MNQVFLKFLSNDLKEKMYVLLIDMISKIKWLNWKIRCKTVIIQSQIDVSSFFNTRSILFLHFSKPFTENLHWNIPYIIKKNELQSLLSSLKKIQNKYTNKYTIYKFRIIKQVVDKDQVFPKVSF